MSRDRSCSSCSVDWIGKGEGVCVCRVHEACDRIVEKRFFQRRGRDRRTDLLKFLSLAARTMDLDAKLSGWHFRCAVLYVFSKHSVSMSYCSRKLKMEKKVRSVWGWRNPHASQVT